MAENKDSPVWGALGKLSLFIGIVAAGLGIFKHFTDPSAAITAKVVRGDFYAPPQWQSFRHKVEYDFTPADIEPVIKRSVGAKESDSFMPLSIIIFDQIRKDLGLQNLSEAISYQGYWHAEIRNVGELQVESVQLRLPSSKIALIKREDGTELLDTTGPVIEIGTVGAGQTLEVTAWGGGSFDYDKPSIFHQSGAGSISMPQEPTLWEWISGHVVELFFAFLMFIAGLLVTLGIGDAYLTAKKKRRAQEDTSAPQ